MMSCCKIEESDQHWQSLVQSWYRRNILHIAKFAAIAMLTAGAVGCGSGGSGDGPGSTASASACYKQIQEGLASYGTPDEIQEKSITFDDGRLMLIEMHIYTEIRLIRSFGFTVEDNQCDSWEEGLTI